MSYDAGFNKCEILSDDDEDTRMSKIQLAIDKMNLDES